MKLKYSLPLLYLAILSACTSSTNSPEFIDKATGKYLYNADEIVEVYFENKELHMIWRGAEKIKPMRLNDSAFYVKEMNKKIQFLTNPEDQFDYIGLVSKDKNAKATYDYRKLAKDEKIPSEYLEDRAFEKALAGYLAIKEKDSLDPAIGERQMNSLGYRTLYDQKDKEKAIAIFTINAALYPNSYNVYDSLGEAYLKNGDTVNALDNYKKSLVLDSGNKRLKRTIAELEKRE